MQQFFVYKEGGQPDWDLEGLQTRVRAGENRGKTLTHDFVALGMASVTLKPTAHGYRASVRLPDAATGAIRRAVAAWVTSGDRQAPIQSVGGFLP